MKAEKEKLTIEESNFMTSFIWYKPKYKYHDPLTGLNAIHVSKLYIANNPHFLENNYFLNPVTKKWICWSEKFREELKQQFQVPMKESKKKDLKMKGKLLSNAIWKATKQLDRLTKLSNELDKIFPWSKGCISRKFIEDNCIYVMMKNSEHYVWLDREYNITEVDNYQLTKDDSDNYERHLDGK